MNPSVNWRTLMRALKMLLTPQPDVDPKLIAFAARIVASEWDDSLKGPIIVTLDDGTRFKINVEPASSVTS